jgi:Phage integrase, N-terminal SAM-like domain
MSSRSKRGRSFGTIRRLPSCRWQVRYYDRAGTRHTAPRTFPSKADATRHLAQVEADLLRGVWTDPRLARITFGEWVERWQQTTADLRPGTRALYDYLLRRFLLPAFGTTPLGKLDTLTVRAWLGELHQAAEVTPPRSPRPTGCCAASSTWRSRLATCPATRPRSRAPGSNAPPRCGT